MKILAIRGKNLASLAGEFVLDFQSEPLASAGLYAITGPTGSGKSTLLDALCLALYEQTPRLSGIAASGNIMDVGTNAITPGDVRTILRRGSSDGFAEVDFIGVNGVAYRSRWAVRRAHGKANGKLQQSEISLVRISDGQSLGDHRKGETLRLIQSFVGLSFAHFTRAVMLAQNDFSAFLKASDDVRAELLQTLTGTESYAKISMLAFERMKTEKEKLAQLEQQWQALKPLTSEQSAEKAAQLGAQSEQLTALTQQKTAVEANLRGYQQFEQLKAAEAQAQQMLAAAQAEETAAAARLAVYVRLDNVQTARPLCADLARLNQAEADAKQAHERAETALLQAKAGLDELSAKQTLALSQCEAAEVARMHAQADIDAAKALDARIATIAPQAAAALSECENAAAHLQHELSQQADVRARMQTDQAQLASAQNWLHNNQALRPLAESWQRWEILFDEAQKILARLANADTEVAQFTQALSAFELKLVAASEAKSIAAQAFELTSAALGQLSAELAKFDIEQLVADKAALEQNFEQLQSARNLWQKRTELQTQKHQQNALLHQHSQTLSTNRDALRADLQNLPVLECAEQIAKESLQLATLAASTNAQAMRAGLQPEKPCPVCGALAHPFAEHAPATNMLKSLQDQLTAKQKALREAEILIASARDNVQRSEQSIRDVQRLLSELEQAQLHLNADWAGHPMQIEMDAVPELHRAQSLADRQNGVRAALAGVREQEAGYRDTLKRKEAAQMQLDRDNHALNQANAAHSHLASQRGTASQNLATAQRDQAELTRQLAAHQDQLDAAFQAQARNSEWRLKWRNNPQVFVRQLRTDVDTWSAQLTNISTLTRSMAQLEITLSAGEKACLQASELQTTRREKHAALDLELQSYRQQRSALFAGQAIAHVEAAFNLALQQAKHALSAAESLLQDARAQLAAAQEALRQTEIRQAQEHNLVQAAQLKLHAWVVQFNSTSEALVQHLSQLELDSLLKITPEWRAREQAALQALKHAVASAQAVVADRTQRRSAFAAEQGASEALEVLQDKQTQVQLEISTLDDTIARLKLEIALDAQTAQQATTLGRKIDKQTADAFVWSQLGELIGSADGKKFRNFAQQLTLDILLKHANLHLQSLTRRYRVQRIHDSLGLLVVDQDMGDEVRSVHSLSGGESFLLSLALALGLASLSAHRVQVQSLFIDEGFGSLDAESLSIAMDALDNLQSQGRKVGVISHLQELTERISVRVQVQRLAAGLSRIVTS